MIKWTEMPAGIVNAAIQRVLVSFGDYTENIITSLANEPDYVSKLTDFAKKNWYVPTASQKKAQEIMGKNFFGIEEAIRFYGVNPSKQQIGHLAEVPFSVKYLEASKDTHILVAVFPMSINDIRKYADGQNLFYGQTWYDNSRFATEKGQTIGWPLGWELIRKEPVKASFNKGWKDQRKSLPLDEGSNSVQVAVYTMVGHHLASGERLFEEVNVRCFDTDTDGRYIQVGFFSDIGLCIYACADTDTDEKLGVFSSKNQCNLLIDERPTS